MFIYANNIAICHRTWFKVVFNPVLRVLQFWTEHPYVIVSNIENNKCVGYGIRRVKLAK